MTTQADIAKAIKKIAAATKGKEMLARKFADKIGVGAATLQYRAQEYNLTGQIKPVRISTKKPLAKTQHAS